jgi:hypothetical protein
LERRQVLDLRVHARICALEFEVKLHRLDDPTDADLQNSLEDVGIGGDQPTTVEDNFLLQHSVNRIGPTEAGVDGILNLRRSHRPVKDDFLLTDHANGDLKRNFEGFRRNFSRLLTCLPLTSTVVMKGLMESTVFRSSDEQ